MKLLVLQIAGLGYQFALDNGLEILEGVKARPMETVFPALTSPAQAMLRCATPPGVNGVIANGFMDRDLRKPLFWEQSSALVKGDRIWQSLHSNDRRVGIYFFQQSLGETADQIISPAPIHKHGGGLINACSSKPESLYPALSQYAGGSFKLQRYWGPLASTASGRWISQAITGLLKSSDAPEIVFCYLPTLDYDLQRFGISHSAAAKAARELRRQLEPLLRAALDNGYEIAAFGDYAITNVTGGAIFPNKALKRAGLLKTRGIRKMRYADICQSSAFAVVDHQIALVTCFNPVCVRQTADLLRTLEGVDEVMESERQEQLQIRAPGGADLIVTAKPGYWFAYPWWDNRQEAPDYAGHVDIHNKPGFDPCELFFGNSPLRISQKSDKVKGTHGLIGPGLETALYTTLPIKPASLLELSQKLRDNLKI